MVNPGEADEYGFGSGSLGMGFGYDSKTDDYKIVRILTSPDGAEQSYSSDSDEANDSSSPCYGAELTTLGSGIWRTIERPLDGYSLRRLCSYAYCKGMCYWITYSIESVIICFDMWRYFVA